MKKTHYLVSIISFICFAATTAFSLLNLKDFKFNQTQADIEKYQMVFDSEHNKFHSYSGFSPYNGDTVAKTNLGNDINFTYYQLTGSQTSWHKIAADGYFYNTRAIHGLQQINLLFNNTSNVNVSISFSKDKTFDHSRTFTYSSISFNFDNYLPHYFKITNNSSQNLDIVSINLTYSCLTDQYANVTVLSNDETKGTVTGGGVKAAGETVEVKATPNDGYYCEGWYIGSNLIDPADCYYEPYTYESFNYSFIMGLEDIELTAKFAPIQLELVVYTESEEKGTVSESGYYEIYSNVEVTAYPKEGYVFDGWYDYYDYDYYGEFYDLISSENPYSFSLNNPVYLIAKFSPGSYKLSLNTNNSSMGTVSAGGTYTFGDKVTVSAYCFTGADFLGWYDENDNLVSTSLQMTITMPGKNTSYTAKFGWINYDVIATPNDPNKGTVSGSGTYIYGEEVTLTATPFDHCSFYAWYDENGLVSKESTISFNMPNQSVVIEAMFVSNHYINVINENDDRGSVSYESEIGCGFKATLTANAQVGYALDYWYDSNHHEISDDNSYSFFMPDHDVTLYVSFTTGFTLQLISSNEGCGVVVGSGQYKVGKTVIAKMEPVDKGVYFDGWTDEDDNVVSYDNPYSFTMPNNDVTLTANYKPMVLLLMSYGSNCDTVTINEQTGYKVGTSKYGGSMAINISSAVKRIVFHVAAWRYDGGTIGLTATNGVVLSETSITIIPDSNIHDNGPYNTYENEDTYVFEILVSNNTEGSSITVASSGAQRFIVWGAYGYIE